MKNVSGVSLLRVLPMAHRPPAKLPLAGADRAAGGPGEATARSIARRLVLALHDLGLDAIVPAGWVSVDGAAVAFGELDVPAADRLVRHLEDIAADVADVAARVAPLLKAVHGAG
jgi:hypothetical protein